MGQFLLALLTDAVMESAASARRDFATEMKRYFERKGLGEKSTPRSTRTP